jgi:hypothetical protein
MPSRRPAVRNVTEFHLPAPYPEPRELVTAATAMTTSLMADAGRQWLDLWFTGAQRATEAWLTLLQPPTGRQRSRR